MCKYGLLYLVASVIAVLRVQLRFVDCINKQKKRFPISLYTVRTSAVGHGSGRMGRVVF